MSSTGLTLITEGQGKAYLPKGVFYNPVQEFNRDLTVNVISEYGKIVRQEREEKLRKRMARKNLQQSESCDKQIETEADGSAEVTDTKESSERVAGQSYPDGMRILEALAASGLRSVRFCKEIPGVHEVIGNDYSHDAVKTMEENIKLNDVGHLMTASCDDAAMVMYKASRDKSGLFDVIDLDPYGGPTQFLDGAVQAIKDGGLLCITCTDMAILCGNASEKCFAAYGASSLKSSCCHEMALRIVLRTIDSYANRYAKSIVPLLSVSVDFYCRVFVRVYSGAQKAKESASKSAMVYECTGCMTHHLQPLGHIKDGTKFTFSKGPTIDRLCEHCNHPHHIGKPSPVDHPHDIGGPLWSAPIHDMDFVSGLIARVLRDEAKFGTSKRIIGMMSLVSEELPDVPLYYKPDKLSGVLHTTSPGFLPIRSAILHAGYRVSLSHAAINSIKTDAPPSVLWDIMKCWCKKNGGVSEKRIISGTPCAAILNKEPELEANFEIHALSEPESRKQGMLRFQNGKKDWGPKARDTNDPAEQNDKRRQNQNKRDRKRTKKDLGEKHYKQYHCAAYRKTRKCEFGEECRYSHDIPVDGMDSDSVTLPVGDQEKHSDTCDSGDEVVTGDVRRVVAGDMVTTG